MVGPTIEKDIFTGELRINSPSKIISGARGESFSKLIFGPAHRKGINFISLIFQKKEFNPSRGDVVLFLFDDNEVREFRINEDPHFSQKHSNWGELVESLVPISLDDLHAFSTKKFISWRFVSGKRELTYLDGIAHVSFTPISNLQYSIRTLFSEFLSIVSKEIPASLEVNPQELEGEIRCSLYLMKDLTNGMFKIGISNNPQIREKTLQSEKPTIELIYQKEFRKRSIALMLEKSLHNHFDQKRIRGEWFALGNEDFQDIKDIFI